MPTPGVDIAPFASVLVQGDVKAWLGGADKEDRANTPVFPGRISTNYARNHNRIVSGIADIVTAYLAQQTDLSTLQSQMATRIAEAAANATHFNAIDAAITSLQSAAASGYRVDITKAPYNCVADGTASNHLTATDNKAGLIAALAFCKSTGFELYVPGNTLGKTYRCYFNDVVGGASGAGYILIDFPNLRISGDGPGLSIIEGVSDRRTPRAQIASIVGNQITCVTKSDATRCKALCRVHVSAAADGTGLRAESGIVNITSAGGGNGTTGVFTVNDATLISGMAVGDYIYLDYGHALFKHSPAADSATVAYNLTVKDIEFRDEWYGSTLDGTGANNANLDTQNFCWYLEPRSQTTTPWHTLYFGRVKISTCYQGIVVTGGGSGSYARTKLHLRDCDVQGGVTCVFMSTNDDWAEKIYCADNTYFHDTDATVGSHLNYINAQVSIAHTNCRYDNWRAAKYGLQHWGTALLQAHTAVFVAPWFGSGGLGCGILTNEHSSCEVYGGVWECAQAMQLRSSTTVKGGYVLMKAGGAGFATYADCQYGAHISLDDITINLVNVGLTGHSGIFIVDDPVTMLIRSPKVIALTQAQDTASVPQSVNSAGQGGVLVVHSSSVGGHVTMSDARVTMDTANTNSQVCLAHLGADGAAVRLERNRVIGRIGAGNGVVRVDNRTQGVVELFDNDFTQANNNNNGRIIFANSTTGTGIVRGSGNKLGGSAAKGCTFGTTIQNLRLPQASGSNIASAASITWDPDVDFATITGTTSVDSLVFPGTSALNGFHGAVLTVYVQDGFSTTTAGNFAAASTLAAGTIAVFRYNAVTAKWLKV